jgi:extradiol dioxygenase family protein
MEELLVAITTEWLPVSGVALQMGRPVPSTPAAGAMMLQDPPVWCRMQSACFHLSIPSHDLRVTERWYVEGLGCRPGRRSAHALILDLGGHQLVAQLTARGEPAQPGIYPRHFGLVLANLEEWKALRDRVADKGLAFAVAPKCRYGGEILEHHTFFLIDPSDNWLEFKHYSHPQAILGCREQKSVGDPDLREAETDLEDAGGV